MISYGARPNAANRAASGLDGLDGRYLGPVNVRSSSRGCGRLKVLDCAMVWMLVRRASPRSPAPCAMTRGIACSRIRSPSGTSALAAMPNGPSLRREQERSQSLGHRRQWGHRKVVSAPLAIKGWSLVPARGRRRSCEEHGQRLRAHWTVRGDRSERVPAGPWPSR